MRPERREQREWCARRRGGWVPPRALAAAALLGLAAAGCRSVEPPPAPAGPGGERGGASPEELRESEPPRPLFERAGRDTYIYHMRWQRAAETVETLRALLGQSTDREIILVPHEETNSILIKILPRRRGESPPPRR